MSKSCTDQKLGSLIHAYELDMLSEEELNSFEAHLLECDFCFELARKFAPHAVSLSSSPDVSKTLKELNQQSPEQTTLKKRFWNVLWPDFPFILRPAALLFVLAVLIYPAYMGLISVNDGGVSQLRSVELVPMRATQLVELDIESETDIVLSFVIPDARSEGEYSLSLSFDNAILYQDDRFSNFDSYGVAYILVPFELVKTGQYHLVIKDNEKPVGAQQVEYKFALVAR